MPLRGTPGESASSDAADPGDPDRDVDRLYVLGINARLARRCRDAYDSLSRASQIRTTAGLIANLDRLRGPGFK